MKSFLVALSIVATIWCYPFAIEYTIDPCDALASEAMRIEAKPDTGESQDVSLIKSLGDIVVPETVTQRYPSVPRVAVCIGYYWRLVVDPDLVGAIKGTSDVDGMIDRRMGTAGDGGGGSNWTTGRKAAP